LGPSRTFIQMVPLSRHETSETPDRQLARPRERPSKRRSRTADHHTVDRRRQVLERNGCSPRTERASTIRHTSSAGVAALNYCTLAIVHSQLLTSTLTTNAAR